VSVCVCVGGWVGVCFVGTHPGSSAPIVGALWYHQGEENNRETERDRERQRERERERRIERKGGETEYAYNRVLQ
jgi:hypothetical protein